MHTMEELEEFAQARRGFDFLSGGNTRNPTDRKPSMMMADMEDIFDFNERLSSPEYERYRSFRRLSVLDEVSLVSQADHRRESSGERGDDLMQLTVHTRSPPTPSPLHCCHTGPSPFTITIPILIFGAVVTKTATFVEIVLTRAIAISIIITTASGVWRLECFADKIKRRGSCLHSEKPRQTILNNKILVPII